jgi:hypothetical protein
MLRDVRWTGAGPGFLLTLTCLLLASGPAQALLIGGTPQGPGDRSFIPFGGITSELSDTIFNTLNPNRDPTVKPRLQQVYDATTFGVSSISIQEIKFYQFDPDNAGINDTLNLGTYTITLSTTSRAVTELFCPDCPGGLMGSFDSNVGGDAAVFQVVPDLSAIFSNGVLSFGNLANPFVYDPTQGNLLIDIEVSDFDPDDISTLVQGTDLFFESTDMTFEGPEEEDLYFFSTVDNFDGNDNTGRGLVTGFFVPEPSPFLLVAGGFLWLGGLRRLRREGRH